MSGGLRQLSLVAMLFAVVQPIDARADQVSCTDPGTNGWSFPEQRLRRAIDGRIMNGPDGVDRCLDFIKRECSSERAARAVRLVNEMKARVGQQRAEEQQRVEETRRRAAEQQAAQEARREEERRQRALEEERKVAEARQLAAEADNAAWNGADATGCRSPKTLDACEKVDEYIKTFPTGIHIDEANQCLRDAKPMLEHLQDQRDWESATAVFFGIGKDPRAVFAREFEAGGYRQIGFCKGSCPSKSKSLGVGEDGDEDFEPTVDARYIISYCRHPKTADACLPLKVYLANHPDGMHAQEVREVLNASAPQLAALEKKEQVRRKKEEHAEAAQETHGGDDDGDTKAKLVALERLMAKTPGSAAIVHDAASLTKRQCELQLRREKEGAQDVRECPPADMQQIGEVQGRTNERQCSRPRQLQLMEKEARLDRAIRANKLQFTQLGVRAWNLGQDFLNSYNEYVSLLTVCYCPGEDGKTCR